MLSFSQRVIDKTKTTLNLKPSWGAVANWSGQLGTMPMLARNLYFVRVPTSNGMSATPWHVRGPYSSPVPMMPNTIVDLGYDTDGAAFIKNVNFGAMLAAGGNPVPIPDPPAGKVTPQSQIATLRCFQDANQPSLKVNINGWKAIVAGVRYNFPGYNQFDLTSFVPGSGHCIVGIFIKDDNITPIAYASTAIPINDSLGDADVQDVISQAYAANHAYTPVWAYAVAAGATQILDSDTFEDERQFIDASGSGGGSGTVTNVATGTGLSGGPITTTGTIALANTAVTPGAYTSTNLTVDAQGRITAAASGGGGGSSITKTTKSLYVPTILWDKTLSGTGTFDTNNSDDFGNSGALSGSYDHLEIYLWGRANQTGGSDENAQLTFNNDTTNGNYFRSFLKNTTGTVSGATANDRNAFLAPDSDVAANNFAQSHALIELYAGSSAFKIAQIETTNSFSSTFDQQYRNLTWESTAAITRIAVAINAGDTNFVSGSRMQVVGIKAQTVVTDVTGAGTVQFTTKDSVTLDNSTTETSLINLVSGAQTLPANALSSVGRMLRFSFWGYESDTGTPTAEIKFKLGSTVIFDSGTITLGSGISNKLWHFFGEMTVQVSGASGKVIGQAQFVQNGITTDIIATSQISLDTTPTLLVDCPWQWGALSVSDTVTMTNGLVEILN